MRKTKGKVEGVRGARGRPDPWQKAVYDFEGSWLDWNRKTLTLAEMKAGIGRACRKYGLRPPPVRTHRGRSSSFCYDDGSLISFKRKHMNPAVAMHEASHYIVDRLFGDSPEDHGVAFQGVYFWLLVQTALAPLCAIRAAAREHGLKWRYLSPELARALAKGVPT